MASHHGLWVWVPVGMDMGMDVHTNGYTHTHTMGFLLLAGEWRPWFISSQHQQTNPHPKLRPQASHLRIQVIRDFKQHYIITIQLATRPKRTGLKQPLNGCNWLKNGLLKDQPTARLCANSSLRMASWNIVHTNSCLSVQECCILIQGMQRYTHFRVVCHINMVRRLFTCNQPG